MNAYPTLDAWHACAADPGWVKAWCDRCDRWHFHRLPLCHPAGPSLVDAACVVPDARLYRIALHEGPAPSIDELRGAA